MITLVKIAVLGLRMIYAVMKLFLKPRNKITMLSRQDNKAPLGFQLIEKAVREKDKQVEIVILSKKIEGSIVKKVIYCFHILEQMYHIATSKMIIVDGFCIPVSVLNHKPNQIVVQTWHALTIIKKFGYLALDMPAGASRELAEAMCMHRNYNYILSSGKKNGEILAKSFNASEDAIVLLGLPYVDYIQNPREEVVEKIIGKYPQLAQKENILYVPTFRKNHRVDIGWICQHMDLDKYNVIVKLHPIDKKGVEGNIDSRIIVDEDFTTYEWLWVCENVVTDYSGVGMESSLLNRKLFFYLYDRKEYEKETGLNVDLYQEPISKYVTESAEHLAKLMNEEYDFSLLEQYREKYIEIDTEDCSGQFAAWILKKLYQEKK